MNVTGVILVLFALVGVAVMAYRAGYWRGQAELLRQEPTEAEWSVLPRWRRVAGWAAYVFSGLLFCLFLFLAYRYAQSRRWTFWVAAWVLWFAIFLGGIWLAEWCLKPDRETQRPPIDDDDSNGDTPSISFRGRPTAMIAAIYAHKSTGYGGPTVLNSEPIAP